MSMTQKKLQKQKDRAKAVRKKMVARRAAVQAVKSEETQAIKRIRRIAKLQKSMQGLDTWADDVLLGVDDATLSQLEKNVEILRALEAEHKAELDRKDELNRRLEAEGHVTLEEKMSALSSENAARQRAEFAAALAADATPVAKVEPAPVPAPAEVAEVEVVRASDVR